jgi:hypothetical protein
MAYTPYKFPGKLLFRHLKQHEIFYFKSGDTGPFMKISARRYVPVTVTFSGHKIIPHWDTSKGVYYVDTINVEVNDRVMDKLF